MHFPQLHPAALLALGSIAALHCDPAAAQAAAAYGPTLNEVTFTGDPLDSSDLIAPATTLASDKLLLR
jgi:hypothetical protein